MTVQIRTSRSSPSTVWIEDSVGKLTIKQVPEVDIPKWMSTLDLANGSYAEMFPQGSPTGKPAVMFVRKISGKDKLILSVWGETHGEIVNLFFVARPYEPETPFIHMKFTEWNPARAMSAILAVAAFHAERPKLPRKDKIADAWLKKMRDKILKSFYRNTGTFSERGIDEQLVEAEKLAHKRFNSLAGLDVQESIERVKKEFRLLSEHLTEEEVSSIWRECIVRKVMDA